MIKEFVYVFMAIITFESGGERLIHSHTVQSLESCRSMRVVTREQYEKLDGVKRIKSRCLKIKNTRSL